MKSIQYGIWLFMLFALMACGGGGDDKGSSSEPAVREMQLNQTVSGFIETEGDVDTFHLRPVADSRFVKIHCSEATTGSPVELLVTVYAEQDNGERVRIFGKQQRDGSTVSADLDLLVYIDDFDKDLYITVRDYMDDEYSKDIAYNLIATLEDGPGGNHDFSSAKTLEIGPDGATSDEIEEIGEVDSFTFSPQSDGVFKVNVDHPIPDDGTDVKLAVTMYDRNGNKIQYLAYPLHTILAHLTADGGPYYVIVEDRDSMYSDSSASYEISVEAVPVDEPQRNDVIGSATPIEIDDSVYTAAGVIDYGCASAGMDPAVTANNFPDVDWYALVIGQESGEEYHQIEFKIEDGEAVAGKAPIRVIVYDAEDKIITSHIYTPNGGAYLNQFRVQDGRYFISVAPFDSTRLDQGVNYQVKLTEVELNDPAEADDRNVADTALSLDEGSREGVISYHSDVDWYSINVDTSVAQVVSVDFTTPGPSIVDYQVSIWRGTHMYKRVTDADGSDGPTHLKTSVLIKADTEGEIVPITIKVNDAQNSEGSNVVYTISANVTPVPVASPAHILNVTSGTLRYYSETAVEALAAEEDMIQLEIFSTQQPTFKVNTSWLDFRTDPLAAGITRTAGADDTTVITFPWITGYADYQGDRDFFKLDLGRLDPLVQLDEWYYELQFRLVSPAAGSSEYVWKLYRDSNGNHTFMDNPGARDGIVVCAGDTTQAANLLDLTSPPAGDDPFWIGNVWSGGQDPSMFYFAVSDFEYERLPDGSDNPDPDNDWGYDQPYYFTLTLIYHPGKSSPTDND